MHCGIEFEDARSQAMKDVNPRRFCSRACKDKARIADGRSSAATRRSQLKAKYGITQDEYMERLDAQLGGCAICGRTEPIGRVAAIESMWLHVDHDHKNGRVRGLLCSDCNTGLGKFGDCTETLQAAIDYLKEN